MSVTPLAAEAAGYGNGPLALVVIVLLGIATVLLIRNMNARLKRMPPSFEETPPEGEQQPPPSDEQR